MSDMACQEYREAPNPTPKPLKIRAWALSNQKGQFAQWGDGTTRLYSRRPAGFMTYWTGGRSVGETLLIYKPRRVVVTIE